MAQRPRSLRDAETVSVEEAGQLVDRYWHGDEPRSTIEADSGLRSIDFGRIVGHLPTGDACDRCGGTLVWKSRQARAAGKSRCLECRHQKGGVCNCRACHADEEARFQQAAREDEERRQAAVDAWLMTYGSDEYLQHAIKKVSPSIQSFLVAAQSNPYDTFAHIADRAGVPRRFVESHLQRLQTWRVLFFDGRHYHWHPGLERLAVLAS